MIVVVRFGRLCRCLDYVELPATRLKAELLPTFQKHRQGIGLQLAENPDYKDVEVQPDDGDPLHVVGLVVSVSFNL